MLAFPGRASRILYQKPILTFIALVTHQVNTVIVLGGSVVNPVLPGILVDIFSRDVESGDKRDICFSYFSGLRNIAANDKGMARLYCFFYNFVPGPEGKVDISLAVPPVIRYFKLLHRIERKVTGGHGRIVIIQVEPGFIF